MTLLFTNLYAIEYLKFLLNITDKTIKTLNSLAFLPKLGAEQVGEYTLIPHSSIKRKGKSKLAGPDDFVIVENIPLNVSKENSVGLFLRLEALHIIDIDTIIDEVQEEEEAETERFIFDTKCYNGEDANISILDETVSNGLKWCKTMNLTGHRALL